MSIVPSYYRESTTSLQSSLCKAGIWLSLFLALSCREVVDAEKQDKRDPGKAAMNRAQNDENVGIDLKKLLNTKDSKEISKLFESGSPVVESFLKKLTEEVDDADREKILAELSQIYRGGSVLKSPATNLPATLIPGSSSSSSSSSSPISASTVDSVISKLIPSSTSEVAGGLQLAGSGGADSLTFLLSRIDDVFMVLRRHKYSPMELVTKALVKNESLQSSSSKLRFLYKTLFLALGHPEDNLQAIKEALNLLKLSKDESRDIFGKILDKFSTYDGHKNEIGLLRLFEIAEAIHSAGLVSDLQEIVGSRSQESRTVYFRSDLPKKPDWIKVTHMTNHITSGQPTPCEKYPSFEVDLENLNFESHLGDICQDAKLLIDKKGDQAAIQKQQLPPASYFVVDLFVDGNEHQAVFNHLILKNLKNIIVLSKLIEGAYKLPVVSPEMLASSPKKRIVKKPLDTLNSWTASYLTYNDSGSSIPCLGRDAYTLDTKKLEFSAHFGIKCDQPIALGRQVSLIILRLQVNGRDYVAKFDRARLERLGSKFLLEHLTNGLNVDSNFERLPQIQFEEDEFPLTLRPMIQWQTDDSSQIGCFSPVFEPPKSLPYFDNLSGQECTREDAKGKIASVLAVELRHGDNQVVYLTSYFNDRLLARIGDHLVLSEIATGLFKSRNFSASLNGAIRFDQTIPPEDIRITWLTRSLETGSLSHCLGYGDDLITADRYVFKPQFGVTCPYLKGHKISGVGFWIKNGDSMSSYLVDENTLFAYRHVITLSLLTPEGPLGTELPETPYQILQASSSYELDIDLADVENLQLTRWALESEETSIPALCFGSYESVFIQTPEIYPHFDIYCDQAGQLGKRVGYIKLVMTLADGTDSTAYLKKSDFETLAASSEGAIPLSAIFDGSYEVMPLGSDL